MKFKIIDSQDFKIILRYSNGQTNIMDVSDTAAGILDKDDEELIEMIRHAYKQQNYTPEKINVSLALLVKEVD